MRWVWREDHWSSNNPPDDEWFKYRIDLFRKYTYPSILSQTNQDFEWLVFFNGDTDRSVVEEFDRVTPIFLKNDHPWRYRDAVDALWPLKKDDVDWIVTSTIDVDDMYHPNMVQMVQDVFTPQPAVFDFMNGLFHDISDGSTTMYAYDRWLSPFFSMVEPWDRKRMRTCKFDDHAAVYRRLTKKMLIHQIETQGPMWLTCVHDKNTIAQIKKLRIGSEARQYLPQFGIDNE